MAHHMWMLLSCIGRGERTQDNLDFGTSCTEKCMADMVTKFPLRVPLQLLFNHRFEGSALLAGNQADAVGNAAGFPESTPTASLRNISQMSPLSLNLPTSSQRPLEQHHCGRLRLIKQHTCTIQFEEHLVVQQSNSTCISRPRQLP
mmetsp:Transcript_4801/g.9398  ORF Transcript_4801/g.9398 Transcript_4801/m.9398 type:complete len:146 (+) Transcript_4801:120-557(+)